MKLERIPTHIPGFDQLVEGGLLTGCTYLVTGQAGSGKTTFALETLHNMAKYENKNALFISLEEPIERVKQFMSRYNLNFDELEKKGNMHMMDLSLEKILDGNTEITESFDLSGFYTLIRSYIEKYNIDILVLDSLPVLTAIIPNPVIIRNQLLTMKAILNLNDCISVLISEIPEGSKNLSKSGIEEFIVDGVIILKNVESDFRRIRGLEVFKMRGTNLVGGTKSVTMDQDGIRVHEDWFVNG